jgi:excisionase family DNA binding protein
MVSFNLSGFPSTNSTGILTEKYITVQAAAEITGYNVQYLRRLLRLRKLGGVKVGQVWLIKMDSLRTLLKRAQNTSDKRYGPKKLIHR